MDLNEDNLEKAIKEIQSLPKLDRYKKPTKILINDEWITPFEDMGYSRNEIIEATKIYAQTGKFPTLSGIKEILEMENERV